MTEFKSKVSKSGGRKYVNVPQVHHDDFEIEDKVLVKKLKKKEVKNNV